MDKSDPPTSARRSRSRHEKQPPLRPPPHRSASALTSCDVASAAPPPGCRTTGGRAVSLPPSGHARNLRSAAVLESTEVTPILNSFPTGNNAEIRAAIEDEARAFSVGDDDVEAGVVDVNAREVQRHGSGGKYNNQLKRRRTKQRWRRKRRR